MRYLAPKDVWVVLFLIVATVGLLRAQPDNGGQGEMVLPLLKQLGDDDYARRETATEELAKLGFKALPELQQAASDGTDAEVRWRARQLVRAILYRSKATGMTLVPVDAGEFSMGSPNAEPVRKPDEVHHKVKISKPFLLGAFEVTQQEYELVMKANPSWFAKTGGGKLKIGAEETNRFPVERVSWFDAIEFCNRLSKQDGFPPYYALAQEEREGDSIKSAKVTVVGGIGYRLPTEAEWEYACRAGSTSPFYFGAENSGREANVKPVMIAGGYGGDSPKFRDFGRTIKVGFFPANRWGLYDMHGNVAEWCEDRYDKDYYANSPPQDPRGPTEGVQRVRRGGSWLDNEASCRSASRFWHTPEERKEFVGFRVARTPSHYSKF